MKKQISVKTGGLAAAVLAPALLTGCEEIHDPWVTGNNYFEEERGRSPEQQEALRDRVLYQAGPGGTGESETYEFARFIEK